MTWESRRVCRLRASSSGSVRRSIASDTGRPVLFGDFLGSMTEFELLTSVHRRFRLPRLPDPDQSTLGEVAVRLG